MCSKIRSYSKKKASKISYKTHRTHTPIPSEEMKSVKGKLGRIFIPLKKPTK